jgi:hypothetical protein
MEVIMPTGFAILALYLVAAPVVALTYLIWQAALWFRRKK